jgi:hypothetical protein
LKQPWAEISQRRWRKGAVTSDKYLVAALLRCMSQKAEDAQRVKLGHNRKVKREVGDITCEKGSLVERSWFSVRR